MRLGTSLPSFGLISFVAPNVEMVGSVGLLINRTSRALMRR